MAQEEWRNIVGARIAGRTRVGKMYRGTLQVKVASSAWCNELSFLKADLIVRLQRAGHDVTDLRMVVDPIARTEGAKSPFRRTQSARTELSPEMSARLQEVDDPNLRAAIAEAARWSLSPKKE